MDVNAREEELSDSMAREDAANRAIGAREELGRLLLRQVELEKSAREWNEKMAEYERSLLREGADELDRLRRDHDDEIAGLVESARVENEIDEEGLKTALAAATVTGRKRAAEGGEEEENARRSADPKNSATGTAYSNASKVGVGGEKVSGSVQKEEELKVCIKSIVINLFVIGTGNGWEDGGTGGEGVQLPAIAV